MKILLVSGDRSGIGKSSVCLGLLSFLLENGFAPSDLAYIKPCTQCEDIQLVTKFCRSNNIRHRGIGPIVFTTGYTKLCIDSVAELKTAEDRLKAVEESILEIGKDAKIVIVDGVGYASVGSVAGVSNAQVARHMKCPVLLVGRTGVGDAIDMCNLNMAYFKLHNAHVLGCVFNNKQPVEESRIAECTEYIGKFFAQSHDAQLRSLAMYGHIPHNASHSEWSAKRASSCVLRATEKNETPSDEEIELCAGIARAHCLAVDGKAILSDLNVYYEHPPETAAVSPS